jgi:hypothetical protein
MKPYIAVFPSLLLATGPAWTQQPFQDPVQAQPQYQAPAAQPAFTPFSPQTLVPAGQTGQPPLRATPPPLPQRQVQPPPMPPPLPTQFYVEENGRQMGPFSLEQIRQRIAEGKLKRWDLAWRTGLATWVKAEEIVEFGRLFDQQPPDVSIEQRIKQLITGTWQKQERNPNPLVNASTRTTIRYKGDGTFTGTQTTYAGVPIVIPIQGRWGVSVVTEKEFVMTLNVSGQVVSTSANLLIIDENTLQDKEQGTLITRVSR